MCDACVRDRMEHAFLTEEQKIFGKVLKAQAQSQKAVFLKEEAALGVMDSKCKKEKKKKKP
jgi:hypothetical protein